MRRVTVRVTEGDDWQFQAERADGTLLFSLEFTHEKPEGFIDRDDDHLPYDDPPRPMDVPYHLGDFGMMLGSPSDEQDMLLCDLRDMVELALPTAAGARVVEIAAGSLESTMAYARGWKDATLWAVDPDLICFGSDKLNPNTPLCRDFNQKKLTCRVMEVDAVELGDRIDKQDLALLLITPRLHRLQQSKILSTWLKHLLPTGRVLLRMPEDGIPLSINGMEVHQAGQWLLYTPAAAEEVSDAE